MAQAGDIPTDIRASALELIGNTPLVALDRLHPGPGRILAKCEFFSPGASIKCRSALNMIRKARERGHLKPGGQVVEVTSGNQGMGLSVVCAVLGHPLTVTLSAGNSIERVIHMEALGTKCIRFPQVDGTYGNVTYADISVAREAAIAMAEDPDVYYIQQFQNEDNWTAHYETTGPEIWRQTGHRVSAFAAAVGTSGTFSGVSKYLKEQNPDIVCCVVEPEGAEAIKGCPIVKEKHLLQGSSYAMIPDLFKRELLDDSISVSDEEALKYKNLLGSKEGLFVGYTSGANVAAAVKLLNSGKLPKDAWVVTILCDSGMKYTPLPDSLKS